ncbi:acyltransferase [Agromyces sp. H3Y2-19a]|uniref:acyltransferase n=1 Tax=Agromyces TaxID=33877 RepID=UPI0023B9ECB6|nr:acyltransferase [Agromyces chromiiresistens]MDF0514655.1 acyltransferase [Agromyces chromiiresistens]
MVVLTKLEPYSDSDGNRIDYAGPSLENVKIVFSGSNNILTVARTASLGRFVVEFNCSNGIVEVGSSRGVPAFSATVRVGEDSRVLIGDNVSTTATCGISATEGTTVSIGADTMIASGVQLRADDGHPIFDVASGRRVNRSKDITIGDHVWLAVNSTVLGGAQVGSGTVVGFGSIVTKSLPNNCVAAGNPARVVKRNTAWERPHLSLVKPYYKLDASTVKRSDYWAPTVDLPQTSRRRGGVRRIAAALRAVVRSGSSAGVSDRAPG